MTWRYVASREVLPDGDGGYEERWGVREFYEQVPGQAGPGWSKDTVAPHGETWIELLEDLGRMSIGVTGLDFLDLGADPPGLRPRKGFLP